MSFALPVRNGESTIASAIESVLAQTIVDWELVISDNLSTDGTPEICMSFAARDERIRYVPTGHDLSQNENFCEVMRLTRGRFVRWYGDDDWLEPTYAEEASTALSAEPDAVLCTTLQRCYNGDTPYPLNDRLSDFAPVSGARADTRLVEFLWIYEHSGWLGIDPVYSLARRDAVMRTQLMSPYRFGDFIYSCEMALQGPFVHVPAVLGHRRIATPGRGTDELERFTGRSGWTRYVQREVSLVKVWQAAGRARARRRSLVVPLLGVAVREHAHGARRRARRLLRR